MAKAKNDLAYEAGQHAASASPEHRHVGANPFEPGTSDSQSWLKGFLSALESGPDPATLLKDVKDAIKAESKASANG
jgi:hypothetical protein